MKRVLVIGAGFSGAVVAREIAEAGYLVSVYDKRSHIGGNCYTERDPETGVTVHKYGPHIFNTNDYEVWDYIRDLGVELKPFTNRVKASNRLGVFSFPINLHTINQFFEDQFTPGEAMKFIAERAKRFRQDEYANFEEQALAMVGAELYEVFFKHYTEKQWGRDAKEIPASVLKRLPLRFSYDDNYYETAYQGIPVNGYTEIFDRLLKHQRIRVHLNQSFQQIAPEEQARYDHCFYTGPIDEYFNFVGGRLSYRTVRFTETRGEGDLQGTAVINYTDDSREYTRRHEHKHFAPWESHSRSIVLTEYSFETGPGDIPYYPVRTEHDMIRFNHYRMQVPSKEKSWITFLGRLGTYRYMNMDQTIREALDMAHNWLQEQ